MRLHIVAVGHLKAGPEKTLCDGYLAHIKGLGRAAGIASMAVTEVSKASSSDSLLRLCPKGAFRIALDEHGSALTTLEFSGFLRKQIDSGVHDLAFLIGGADGHSDATRNGVELLVSLGPMTWPHRLVRAMLAEQIYRAVTIMVNHPYHRP